MLQGLEIDFPEIDEGSDRQIWYAENLRNLYISENYDRFQHIADLVNYELDKRMRGEADETNLDTYKEYFSDEEMCVLFSTKAWIVISVLKEWRDEQ